MNYHELYKQCEQFEKLATSDWERSSSPYYDSAEGLTISKKRALHELKRHGQGEEAIAEFLAELGDRETYDAQEVLRWLGY